MKANTKPFTFTTPAKDMWHGMNPLGRALFFVPGCLIAYAVGCSLFIVLWPYVTFVEWFEKTRLNAWLERATKRLFGARKAPVGAEEAGR